MARYHEGVCRLCRKEGAKLYLKGERCFKDSCAMEKHSVPPGQHGGARRAKIQGYGLQLREKQKLKRMFGLLEKQFRRYFERAEKMKGVTGENLLSLLERRLDNVLRRLGFASSMANARQLIGHGHVRVNGRRVNVPSYLVNMGDLITVEERDLKNVHIQSSLESARGKGGLVPWLEMDWEARAGKVLAMPRREDVQYPISEHLIVELYSKV
ncbi:MAG: 30S ribosomal protein S4 [Acidobacteriota bacterium]